MNVAERIVVTIAFVFSYLYVPAYIDQAFAPQIQRVRS